ncbi:hypothetical protein ACEJ55_18795, partial [Acinetobacter baumannii]
MIESIPMIVLLGAFSGAIFGRYYRPVFVFLYDKVYILLKGLLTALLHKDLKCKAPLIEPNLRRNLGK